MEYTGVCKFCGQVQIVKGGKGLTQEEADRLAVLNCNCDNALFVQICDRKNTYAEANIKKLFAEDGEEFLATLLSCTQVLSYGYVKKLNMTNAEGVKAILTAKENTIKVERTETNKESLES